MTTEALTQIITMKEESIVSITRDTDSLATMRALNDAICILDAAKTATCRDALPIFVKVNNAYKYLCNQLAEML